MTIDRNIKGIGLQGLILSANAEIERMRHATARAGEAIKSRLL